MEKTETSVTTLELKQLLFHLKNAGNNNICFRYRLLGEMWMTNFMQVQNVGDQTVLLYDELVGKYYLLKINNIMQFEIDSRFHTYQPFFHYQVMPSAELE